jgi:hypothetical protein
LKKNCHHRNPDDAGLSFPASRSRLRSSSGAGANVTTLETPFGSRAHASSTSRSDTTHSFSPSAASSASSPGPLDPELGPEPPAKEPAAQGVRVLARHVEGRRPAQVRTGHLARVPSEHHLRGEAARVLHAGRQRGVVEHELEHRAHGRRLQSEQPRRRDEPGGKRVDDDARRVDAPRQRARKQNAAQLAVLVRLVPVERASVAHVEKGALFHAGEVAERRRRAVAPVGAGGIVHARRRHDDAPAARHGR